MDEPVRELTVGVARGDAAAVTRLYRECFDGMYARARRATGRDESFCLDVVQESFVKVLRRMPVCDSREELWGWLNRVVLTTARDMLRREARRARRERESVKVEADDGGGEHAHDVAERIAWITEQLREIEGVTGSAVYLRLVRAMKLAQVGRIVGLKAGAVDGRANRVLGAVREKAREVFDE